MRGLGSIVGGFATTVFIPSSTEGVFSATVFRLGARLGSNTAR